MSTNAMELVLWTVAYDDAEAERFRDDRDTYLGQFRLDDEEKSLIYSADVRRMADRHVNEMLLSTFFRAIYGRAGREEYLRRMNGR